MPNDVGVSVWYNSFAISGKYEYAEIRKLAIIHGNKWKAAYFY
jgi:hypothetical protein